MSDQQPILRNYRPEDLTPIHQLVMASAEADQVDPRSTLEGVPTQEELRQIFEAANSDHNTNVLVATDQETQQVVGYGVIRWWEEDDGTFVYLHQGTVHPEHRRKGIGTTLLSGLQDRIHEIASAHPESSSKVYGANTTDTEAGTNEMLQKNGYQKVWSAVEMELTRLTDLKKIDPPEGYDLREPKTEADRRAVYNANKEVYAGNFGSSPQSEEDYQEFLDDNPDTSLWKVLWHGNEVAGFVLSRNMEDGNTAEIMEVTVMPKFRRQGLGKYLMIESMINLRDKGVTAIRLHTDAEGKKGGRQLYEDIGFSSLKEHHRYRKPLDND